METHRNKTKTPVPQKKRGLRYNTAKDYKPP